MFDWLFEGRLTVYLALGVIGLIMLGIWTRKRRRGWLIGVGVVGAVVLTYFLLDRAVETDREQITRRLHAMAQGVRTRNTEQIFQHISENFSFAGTNRTSFRGYVDDLLRRGQVTDLTIWDVTIPDKSGRVSFMAKPHGPLPATFSGAGYRVRATFVREGRGEWKLESFQLFGPLTNDPLVIPNLPR